MKPKVIVITGPTASGKTALSLKLAKKFKGEIVSADSRQIYRGMTIGTAKPPISPAIRPRWRAAAKSSVPPKGGTQRFIISGGIPHYLIDIKAPNQDYTLDQFKKGAERAIEQINKKNKTPLVVGGTGLYLWALLNNLEIPKVKPDSSLRKKLEQMMKRHGLAYLYGKLTALDPEASYIVDPKNPRRVIRALEIVISTKKPLSEQRIKGKPRFDFLVLGIDTEPEKLKTKINRRVEQMFKAGLVDEVAKLIKKYGKRRVPFDAIGYREIIPYLDSKTSLAAAKTQMKTDTWRFSRKQMSWFKRMPIIWIKNEKEAIKMIQAHLSEKRASGTAS